MFKALYNGTYISSKNTGIGEVSLQLLKNLSEKEILFLNPILSSKTNNLKIPSNLSPNSDLFSHLRRLFWLQKNIPYLMKKYKAELYLSPLPEGPLFRNIPSIVLCHDVIPLKFPKFSFSFFYYLIYVPLILHNSKLVLCNSKSTANEINKFYKIPKKKIKVLKLGFDEKKFFPKKLQRNKFFLCVGRHNKYKNLERLLIAFKKFNNKDYKLIFIGPNDKRYTPFLKNYAFKLGINSHCQWKGWVTGEEKLNLFNSCTALIHVSLFEGFGLPVLEALACGTPVIASNISSIKEIIGNNGILVNPKEIEEIKESFIKITSDSLLREEFSKRGPILAAQYSWGKAAKDLESTIKNLVISN